MRFRRVYNCRLYIYLSMWQLDCYISLHQFDYITKLFRRCVKHLNFDNFKAANILFCFYSRSYVFLFFELTFCLLFCFLFSLISLFTLVFCYQNCSDLLWEKIVIVIEKNFWKSRLKAENLKKKLQKFWDH